MNPRPLQPPLPPGLTRRTVLGVTVAGAAGVLTACGGGSDTAGSDTSSSPSASAASSSAPESSAAGGAALAKTADVPVGGGVIVDQKVVVTQPTKGAFKGFSAICTHMRCPVTSVKERAILCSCHGSAYSIEDGSTIVNPTTGKRGPAPKPLAPINVTVQGDEVVQS
jgi:nitrite reductase/ring-hydroxylating ferredoxin subunit